MLMIWIISCIWFHFNHLFSSCFSFLVSFPIFTHSLGFFFFGRGSAFIHSFFGLQYHSFFFCFCSDSWYLLLGFRMHICITSHPKMMMMMMMINQTFALLLWKKWRKFTRKHTANTHRNENEKIMMKVFKFFFLLKKIIIIFFFCFGFFFHHFR